MNSRVSHSVASCLRVVVEDKDKHAVEIFPLEAVSLHRFAHVEPVIIITEHGVRYDGIVKVVQSGALLFKRIATQKSWTRSRAGPHGHAPPPGRGYASAGSTEDSPGVRDALQTV